MKKLSLVVSLLIYTLAFAQNPLIIKSVSGTNIEPISSSDSYGTNNKWNGKVFYQAKGTEPLINLAVTDGTTAGTIFLKNIGTAGPALYARVSQMVAAQNFIYISTLTYVTGFATAKYELWRSDGTIAGTILLKSFDITTTSQILPLSNFTSTTSQKIINVVGDNIYFAGYDVVNGNEFWKSDGTAAGTVLVKNINPGSGGSFPNAFCVVGSKIIFTANDGLSSDLWQTDGTEAGTVKLKDYSPGDNTFGTSGERGSALYKGKMYFYASESTTGTEVWSTDGTEAGTTLLIDANPAAASSIPTIQQSLTFLQDSNFLYFVTRANTTAPYHVWRTDGTTTGTIQLTTAANAIYNSNGVAGLGSYATANGIYFVGYSDSLYKSNGTVAGTFRIEKKLNITRGLIVYKDAAWFIARAANSTDDEPWRSDGLVVNSNRALDVYPGVVSGFAYSSSPFGYFELNNYLFFFADNATGKHLFRYNGNMTFNGTVAGNNWRDSANWNSVIPPGITDTAYISAGLTANITGGNAYAGVLYMFNGSVLNFTNSTDSLFIHTNLQGTSATGNGVLVLRNFNADTARTAAIFSANKLNAYGNVLLGGNLIINNNLNLTGNARLAINNNNVTLAGSSSSITNAVGNYIVTNNTGKLAIENIGSGGRTGNIIFPVGTTSFYNPVTLLNSGVMDAFAVRSEVGLRNIYTNETASGSSYSTGAINNTWFITEANAGGSNANITLQWDALQELPGFDRTQSKFGHYTANVWQLGTASAASGVNPYSFTGNGITSFSPFSVFNTNALLPITSAFLSVTKSGVNQYLKWNIVGTTDGKIAIEKSQNGTVFYTIHNQNFVSISNFVDTEISVGDKVFYRLKIRDENGKITYTNTVVINNKNKTLIMVYPTIFNSQLTIQNNNAESQIIQLFQADGKLRLEKKLNSGTNIINTDGIAPGVYLYKIFNQNNAIEGKIIKQ